MGRTTEKSGALCSRVRDFHFLQHQDQTGSRLLAQWARGIYIAVKMGLTTSIVEIKNVELYLQSPIRLHSVVFHYKLFVNFWPVKNPEKLTGGPTLYVMCQGQSICIAPSANKPPSLSPYLAPPPPPPPPIFSSKNNQTNFKKKKK